VCSSDLSDCPLIDGALVRHGVDLFSAAGDPDLYLSNGIERTYPRGLDFEVFSAARLLEADRRATDPADREHVTPYLYRNRDGRTVVEQVTRATNASRWRITVDTPEDLTLVRLLIEDHGAASLDAEGLIALLARHPELTRINEHVEQKKLGE
jgi:spore coat polysaccharide biosynthesis protein SpsF